MTPFPPPHLGMTTALSEALADGLDAIVIFVDVEEGVPRRLALRSTGVAALTLMEVALLLTETSLSSTRALTDGSGRPALPHLDDALRSLQAALVALDDAQPAPPTIGRA